MVGFSLIAFASSTASMNCRILWPSISMTCQLNARYFIGERLKRHDIFSIAVDLNIIAIHDRGEIIQTIFSSKHHSLPRVPFFVLAVRSGAVHAKIFPVHTSSIRIPSLVKYRFREVRR